MSDPKLVPELPGTKLDPGTTWTRVVADEFWGDAVTPFQFSTLGQWIDTHTTKAIDHLTGSNSIPADAATLRLYRSHVYWNADILARNIDAVPKFARTDQLLSYYPPEWRARLRKVRFKPTKRTRGERNSKRNDPNSTAERNVFALFEHVAAVDRISSEIDLDIDAASDWTALREIFERLFALGVRHFEVIRWGLSSHALGLNIALGGLLRRWLGDDGTLHRRLISGLAPNLTFDTNLEIWKLGRMVSADPALAEIFSGPQPPSVASLVSSGRATRFLPAFADFLATYGHRAFTRDISEPRWVESPDAVIGLVAVAARASEDADPSVNFQTEVLSRESAVRQIEERLQGLRHRWRIRLLRRVMTGAQMYTTYRENQRFALDKILFRIRRVVMGMGEALAGEELIGSPQDIFFLTHDEVVALKGRDLSAGEAAGLITARRESYDNDRYFLPPAYLVGDEPIPTGDVEQGRKMRGVPAAPGAVSGVARVIRSPREGVRLHPGDILVASTTDPGWTPLFLGIAGVVLETGGLLAHGAILARECGIPAVVGVTGATAVIQDGAKLSIDGDHGTVEIVG